MHRQRFGKGLAAIGGTRKADKAGPRLGQRLGPGDEDLAVAPRGHIGPAFVIGGDLLWHAVDMLRRPEAAAVVGRCTYRDVRAVLVGDP
ncbi:hypothetical protein D3C72_1926850 [compost metagenome]